MKRLRRSVLVLVAAALLTGLLLISASILSYHNLTAETLIAELTFDRLAEERYAAHLRTGDGCDEQTLTLLGDQWRIDAAFLKWKYWAVALGLDAQYRLERFEGRYRSTAEQNTQPTLAYDIGPPTAVDVAGLADALGPLNFLVDATYGSSTYHDVETDRVFRVYRGPTGIFTRSAPRASEPAQRDALAVSVRRACAGRPGVWRRIAAWTDGAVRGVAALWDSREI